MKTMLFACVLSLALGLFAGMTLQAEEAGVSTPPVTLVSSTAAAFFALPGKIKPMSPLVQKTRSYCRRDCSFCRDDCYARFRVYCHGYECRQNFVLCMRHCWNSICRYC